MSIGGMLSMSIKLRIQKIYHLTALRFWRRLWELLLTLPTTGMGLRLLSLTAAKAVFHFNRVATLSGLILGRIRHFTKGE